MLLRNATLADGSAVDVTIVGERIEAVGPAASTATDPAEPTDNEVHDLAGALLLPSPVEPHAHLDKALTVDEVPNPAGDLLGAIEAWMAHRPSLTVAGIVERATEAIRLGVANGCTAVRTHVDLGVDIGTVGVEALLEVKAAMVGTVELQIVGLTTVVSGGDGAGQRSVLRDALDMGLDVVGGVPHIETDPAEAIDLALELAAEYGRPIDLHADENLRPDSDDLELLAERVLATGFEPAVTASHCVALGMKAEADQARIAERVAEAGIAVVALPQTNLYLQARDHAVAPPRGLTALAALDRAGVTIAGGGDNLRDPFCPVGRADPLEAAALLVMAGHLPPVAAYRAVSSGGRVAMGLEAVTIEAGSPAELLAIDARSTTEAIAAAPARRLVVHRGRVVADTLTG